MPSASGVYSLPLGYLAVTGQPILASQHNPPLEDIASALTGRLSRDGSAPMTGGMKGVAGTAALPSYAFATDATTGTFKTTNGLGVTVGGTQVAEFTASGLASGVWIPGMIIPWARLSVPNSLWVFPVGQGLLRASYPTLWTIAQAEIGAGNTFFNNGDGSTTFGIGDLRGRTIAAIDNMGGSDAARLASAASFSVNRNTVGGAGGEGAHILNLAEIPSHSHAVTDPGHLHNQNGSTMYSGSGIFVTGGSGAQMNANQNVTQNAVTGISIQNNGGGATHNNMQPTMLCQFIMFAGS